VKRFSVYPCLRRNTSKRSGATRCDNIAGVIRQVLSSTDPRLIRGQSLFHKALRLGAVFAHCGHGCQSIISAAWRAFGWGQSLYRTHRSRALGKLISVDPIVLYVSGANSQVLSYDTKVPHSRETLDIEGNCLDKFASISRPCPIQAVLRWRDSRRIANYLPMPYVVRNGLLVFGDRYRATEALKSTSLEEIC